MAKWLQKRFKKLDRGEGTQNQDLDQVDKETRTCPRCGFGKVKPEANFCRKCGVDLRKEKNNERSI